MKLFFLWLLFPLLAFGLTDVDRQDLPFKNWLKNPGWENGKAGWSVTAGETLTLTTGTSKQERGKTYLTWNPSATTKVLNQTTAITVDEAMKGTNAICGFKASIASGTTTALVRVHDGTNTLASVTMTTSTNPVWSWVSFIVPSSGTINCEVISQADDPSTDFFEAYMGGNFQIANVSQAVLVASGYIEGTAACDSLTRSNATPGAFTADTGCGGPVVESNVGPGILQTTDTDLPKFTVNSLPPGVYEVSIQAEIHSSIALANRISLNISDGTTTTGGAAFLTDGSAGHGHNMISTGVFTYTTTGDRTFELFGSSTAGGAITIFNEVATSTRINFKIKRFPSSYEQAYRADVGPASWTGIHANDCIWTNTTTGSAWQSPANDGSCTFTELTNTNMGTVASTGAKTPGITWTPKRAGTYEVCVGGSMYETTTSNTMSVRLNNGAGTTLAQSNDDSGNPASARQPFRMCANFVATDTSAQTAIIQIIRDTAGAGTQSISVSSVHSATLTWSIKALDFSMNAPVLVNSFTATGSTQANAFDWVTWNVVAGAPTWIDSSGSWSPSAASPAAWTDTGTGDVTIKVNTAWATGITPRCWCNINNNTGTFSDAQNRICRVVLVTVGVPTTIRVLTSDGAASAVDEDDPVTLYCVGKRS